MATTLSETFDGGSAGTAVTTSNTGVDSVNSPGLTFDAKYSVGSGMGCKLVASSQLTRGLWWSSKFGGAQTLFATRVRFGFDTAPPAVTRLVNFQNAGSVLVGVGLDTSRHVVIRNVKTATTVSTSTATLATGTRHRIETLVTMSASAASVTVRIFAGANVDGATPDETITATGLALAAQSDSVMHGISFPSAQSWTCWLDDIALSAGAGATWIGPGDPLSGGGGGVTTKQVVLGVFGGSPTTEEGSTPAGLGHGKLGRRIYRNWPTKATPLNDNKSGLFHSGSDEESCHNAGGTVAISLSRNGDGTGYQPAEIAAADTTAGRQGGMHIVDEIDLMWTRIYSLTFGGSNPPEVLFIYEHEMDVDSRISAKADFKAAWTMLWNRSRAIAAGLGVDPTLVKFTITPTHAAWKGGGMVNWWPGDKYVDICGTDLYNDSGIFSGNKDGSGNRIIEWGSFASFQSKYLAGATSLPQFAAAHGNKPTAVLETNSVNVEGPYDGGSTTAYTGTRPSPYNNSNGTKTWWTEFGAFTATRPELNYIYIFSQGAVWDFKNSAHATSHAGVVLFADSIGAVGKSGTPGPPPPPTTKLHLIYDMDADTWTTTGHSWASLPSKLSIYPAKISDWGYTAPEHVTSGTYSSGQKYVQLSMKHLKASDAYARFGSGSYGCRYHFTLPETSFDVGRIQFTKQWSGASLVKDSTMGWPDSGTWPDAGERDHAEQWATGNITITLHKGPETCTGTGSARKCTHPKKQYHTDLNAAQPVTIRVTVTSDLYLWEAFVSGAWKTYVRETDPSYFQPLNPYHLEGAIAYSSQGAKPDDPNRGDAWHRLSGVKVWQGVASVTDTTPPTPDPSPAPTATAPDSTGVKVVLSACTDPETGVTGYDLRRAPWTGSAGSPTTLATGLPSSPLLYTDASVSPGDVVVYGQRATDGAGLQNAWSAWSSPVTVPTVEVTPPSVVATVAPADGSTDPAADITVYVPANVIFYDTGTTGATVVTVDPGAGEVDDQGLPRILTVSQNTNFVIYSYPADFRGSATALFTAMNPAGVDTATVRVTVADAPPDSTSTPTPRDIWVIPGQAAYRTGDLVDNDLYQALNLDVAQDDPTLVTWQGVPYCVDRGAAGPAVDSTGGNESDPDVLIVPGVLSVASNVYPTGYTMGAGGILTELRSYVETAPALGAVTVVWNLNGSAIGTVTIADGQTNGLLDLSVTVNPSDVLTWDVTSIGSFGAGANLHASWSGAT